MMRQRLANTLLTSSSAIAKRCYHPSTSTAAATAVMMQQAGSSLFANVEEKSTSNMYAAAAAAGVLLSGTAVWSYQQQQQQQQQSQPVVMASSSSEEPRLALTRKVTIKETRSAREGGLHEKYNVDWKTVLGEGTYGSVHPARVVSTGKQVALKKISRHFTDSAAFQMEADTLLRIHRRGGHANVTALKGIYEDDKYYYLVMELVSGGELFEDLVENGLYSEQDASRMANELASALNFLHGSVGMVHADLKPENLLLSSKKRSEAAIKVTDFGSAATMQGDSKIARTESSSSGTTAYWSPERFQADEQEVTPASDMWSVGVILYIMLTGVHPFDLLGNASDEEIAEQIQMDATPSFHPDLVGHLSEDAIDLIKRLMEKDPAKRMTASEMMEHSWVRAQRQEQAVAKYTPRSTSWIPATAHHATLSKA